MQQNQLRLVETLIENIQSPDESVRSPAELQLEKSFTENGSQALMLLGQVSAQSTNSSVRSMSFIVMRRNLIKTDYEVYNKLPEDGRNGLKKLCLGAFEKETEDLVRRQLITFISEIAELELPRNGWPQLFPELARFTKSQNILLRGDAYLIFGDIANITDLDENQMKGLKAVFANGLSDGEMGVRLKSFGAVVAFSTKAADSISKNAQEEEQLLKLMLKVVEDVVKLNDESSLIEVFEDLIDMVNLNPKSIRLYFEQFVKLMSDAAMATNMSKEVRILALEFLVVLAEMDNGVYRRSELYVRRAFMSALVMMLEISDPPNWINDLDDESEEENEIYSEGEVAMDRLSQAFGSARVLKIAIPLIGKFLSHEDWKRRVAGLIAISQMAESVDNEHAEKFVRTVSAFYKDQNPRVVFSAIHCIGQMCEDFAPQIQKQLHGLVLPPLVEILKDSKIVKIQAHAGAALVNFTENVDREVIEPYLKELLSILYTLLQNSNRNVQEQVVTIVACVAASTPKHLQQYLENFVPLLLQNYIRCNSKDDVLFKCKSLEALTFIGVEIDPNKFSSVAHKIMNVSLNEADQMCKLSTDYFDFALQAWVRLARVLKADYSQYLKKLMPLIFRECNEESAQGRDALESDSGDEYNPSGNVAELESALSALANVPRDVGVGFYPFLGDAVAVLNDKIDYWGEESVRVYAARAYSALFSVVCLALKSNLVKANEALHCLSEFIQKLLSVFKDESDFAVKKSILTTISSLLEESPEMGLAYLSQNDNDKNILNTMFGLIKISAQTSFKIDENLKNEENDAEEISRYEAIRELETENVYKTAEVFSTVLKVMGDQAVPTFSAFLDQIINSLTKEDTEQIVKKAMLLIITDAVLYIPNTMQKYAEFLFKLYINLLETADMDIKQTSIYGLGILAEKCNAVVRGKALNLLKICTNLYTSLKTKEEENASTLRENAASTYGRITFACSNEINLNDSFPAWLKMLPIKTDLAETKRSSELLLQVLTSGNERCLGSGLSNLPIILNLLAENFKLVKPVETQQKTIADFVEKIKRLPEQTKNEIVGNLTESAKEMILSSKE